MLNPSPAGAIDRIDSPNVEKGAFSIEYSGVRTFDHRHDKDDLQGHEVTSGYTPTDRWTTELNVIFANEPDQSLKIRNAEWQNTFQFFAPGENWVDSGATVTYAFSTQSHQPDAVEVKLLLEKTWGPFTHTANIALEQGIGKYSSGGPARVFLWSSRYRYNEHVAPGFEIQSDFGKASEHLGFREQEHYIGPAIYGDISEHVGYEAAYLFGVTDASAQSAARILLEYQAHF